MYNLFQHHQQAQQNSKQKIAADKYNNFLRDRQKYKQKATRRRDDRLQLFLDTNTFQRQPPLIPDEYMNRQPVQGYSLSNSVNISCFPVKPSSQLSMFGTTQLSKVTAKRSSQDDDFRLTKDDLGYLAHSLPLKDTRKSSQKKEKSCQKKMSELVLSFEQNRRRLQSAMFVSKDRYRLCQSTHFDSSAITNSQTRPKLRENNPEINEEEKKVYFSDAGQERRKNKTYFKLAKTCQLFEEGSKKQQINSLLSRSQYNRTRSRFSFSGHKNKSALLQN